MIKFLMIIGVVFLIVNTLFIICACKLAGIYDNN